MMPHCSAAGGCFGAAGDSKLAQDVIDGPFARPPRDIKRNSNLPWFCGRDELEGLQLTWMSDRDCAALTEPGATIGTSTYFRTQFLRRRLTRYEEPRVP
jgi:hypothetical protein